MSGSASHELEARARALLARAPGMNFFQLCQLLELQRPDTVKWGLGDTPADEPVRFRPSPTMGFPAGEVGAVEYDDERPQAPPTVRTKFMGLYGVDAAMPPHLIDDIAQRREGHEPVMAFLDQFNHRLNTLLYRTWKKYRYPTGFRPGGTDERSRDLLALAGFDCGRKAERAGWPDSRVLALLGLLNQRTRTAEGLAGVVALVAPGIDVGVEQCHPTWVVVSDQVRLGTGAGQTGSLGGDGRGYGLGRRILCRTKAVRVTLRPVGANQVNELLPGALLYRDLMAALRIYVGIKVDVLLRMEISAAVAPVLALGETRARLAWTSLLKPASDRVMSIPLGRYQAFPDSLSHSAAGVDAGGAA